MDNHTLNALPRIGNGSMNAHDWISVTTGDETATVPESYGRGQRIVSSL
jgi:hypothetical protein